MKMYCSACGNGNSRFKEIEKKYLDSKWLIDFLVCEFTCESCYALNKVEIHSKKLTDLKNEEQEK